MEHLLVHRCQVLRVQEFTENGLVSYRWLPAHSGMRCFVDLQYAFTQRTFTKVGSMVQTAGKSNDRFALVLLSRGADVRPGDRMRVTSGPTVTLEVDETPDEIWGAYNSHLQCHTREVAHMIAAGQL